MIYDKGKVRVPEHSRVSGRAERRGGRVAWLHYLGKILSSKWPHFHTRIHPARNITFYMNTSHHNLSIFLYTSLFMTEFKLYLCSRTGGKEKKNQHWYVNIEKGNPISASPSKLRGELLKSRLDLQVWTWLLPFQMNYCTVTVALSRERLSQQQWKTSNAASKKLM